MRSHPNQDIEYPILRQLFFSMILLAFLQNIQVIWFITDLYILMIGLPSSVVADFLLFLQKVFTKIASGSRAMTLQDANAYIFQFS